VVEHLPSKCETLSSNTTTTKKKKNYWDPKSTKASQLLSNAIKTCDLLIHDLLVARICSFSAVEHSIVGIHLPPLFLKTSFHCWTFQLFLDLGCYK
jgi:hypothetical protein